MRKYGTAKHLHIPLSFPNEKIIPLISGMLETEKI